LELIGEKMLDYVWKRGGLELLLGRFWRRTPQSYDMGQEKKAAAVVPEGM